MEFDRNNATIIKKIANYYHYGHYLLLIHRAISKTLDAVVFHGWNSHRVPP